MQPEEGPIYCRCSLAHTVPEIERERIVRARLREDWERIRRTPVYRIGSDGVLRVTLLPNLGPRCGLEPHRYRWACSVCKRTGKCADQLADCPYCGGKSVHAVMAERSA